MRTTKTIADIRQQIHDDLRKQHPDWVLPNGESPICDAYEARLMDQLGLNSLGEKGHSSSTELGS